MSPPQHVGEVPCPKGKASGACSTLPCWMLMSKQGREEAGMERARASPEGCWQPGPPALCSAAARGGLGAPPGCTTSSACCQVFLKAGVMPRLEKQRDKLIAQKIILLQAACKGFLSRQQFKRLKVSIPWAVTPRAHPNPGLGHCLCAVLL